MCSIKYFEILLNEYVYKKMKLETIASKFDK